MKQCTKIAAIIVVLTGLSGCTQISKTAGSVWGGTKSAAKFVASPVTKLLRGSPKQDYVFTDTDYDVELYHQPMTNYANGTVEIYDTPDLRRAPAHTYTMSNPRDVSFVSLNGESNSIDWRNCEIQSRGYLYMSETDLIVNPEFEVCMRNKGYVMEAEVAHYGTYNGRGLKAPNPVPSYSYGASYP